MLYPEIVSQIEALDVNSIPSERKKVLQPFIDYVQLKTEANTIINLNFICTHNSRRSHLSQVWAQTLSHYFKIKNVVCYSGGTQATALFPVAGKTLEHTGFIINQLSNGLNPVYAIKYATNAHPIIGFSKTYDATFNPASEFAAILTCSSADKGCPIIAGTEKRIPITYEDPKAFDNSPLQLEKYNERSLQIATEMKYVFSNIKKPI
jgi:arsenate reductase